MYFAGVYLRKQVREELVFFWGKHVVELELGGVLRCCAAAYACPSSRASDHKLASERNA